MNSNKIRLLLFIAFLFRLKRYDTVFGYWVQGLQIKLHIYEQLKNKTK